jgi:anti-anti-sigma factor
LGPDAEEKEKEMRISTEELAGGITKVALDGRLDIAGASAVDLKMNVAAGSANKLLIDLEKVSFLGSMGLRSIVLPARAVHSRGGKVVLFAPVEMVESVLKSSGIDALIPIHHDLEAALAALA